MECEFPVFAVIPAGEAFRKMIKIQQPKESTYKVVSIGLRTKLKPEKFFLLRIHTIIWTEWIENFRPPGQSNKEYPDRFP